MGKMKAGPVVSDNGNFIIDAPFPEHMMKKPAQVSVSYRRQADGVALGDDQDVDGCCGGGIVLRDGQGSLLW
jgi:hypothetical protein